MQNAVYRIWLCTDCSSTDMQLRNPFSCIDGTGDVLAGEKRINWDLGERSVAGDISFEADVELADEGAVFFLRVDGVQLDLALPRTGRFALSVTRVGDLLELAIDGTTASTVSAGTVSGTITEVGLKGSDVKVYLLKASPHTWAMSLQSPAITAAADCMAGDEGTFYNLGGRHFKCRPGVGNDKLIYW